MQELLLAAGLVEEFLATQACPHLEEPIPLLHPLFWGIPIQTGAVAADDPPQGEPAANIPCSAPCSHPAPKEIDAKAKLSRGSLEIRISDTRQMLRFGAPGFFPASCVTLEQRAAHGRSLTLDCEFCDGARRPRAPLTGRGLP